MFKVQSFPEDAQFRVSESEKFEIITVNERTKSNLFNKASSQALDDIDRSKSVLQNLRRWNFPISEFFDLRNPENTSAAPLRLLRQQATESQLNEAPEIKSYICLSYCWHSDDWALADGLGKRQNEWPISPAMLRGLIDQRQNDEEGIWIDAVCINQNDPVEKMRAIGSIDMIYKSARRLVVVLEDVILTDSEIRLLEGLNKTNFSELWRLPEEKIRPLASVLIRVFNARWFSRAWCSHEFQLGTVSTFLVPTHNACMELTPDCLDKLVMSTSDFLANDKEYRALFWGCFRSFNIWARASDTSSEPFDIGSAIMKFSDISSLGCSVESDKISIALNVVGLSLLLNRSSISKQTCRFLLAMIALSANDANVLCGDGDRLTIPGVAMESWLHWPKDITDPLKGMGVSYSDITQSIAMVTESQIELDLLFIVDKALRYPIQSTCQELSGLIETLADQIQHWPWHDQPAMLNWAPNKAYQRGRRDFLAEMLACSLECGIAWISHQMSCSKALTDHMQQRAICSNVDFRAFVHKLLDVLILSDADGQSSFSDAEFNSVCQFVALLIEDNLLNFDDVGPYPPSDEESPSDEQSPEDSGRTRCGLINLGASGKALFVLGPGSLKKGHLAIPLALSDTSCAPLLRVWHIVPSESDGGWCLWGKVKLFTLAPIVEDGEHVVKRMGQVVRGVESTDESQD
ncbi:MAG: hypothetical protein Q9168_006406 [Polycauliona sp. 1 TL-2023]